MSLKIVKKQEQSLLELHREKEKLEKLIKQKERKLTNKLTGKIVYLTPKYIEWLHKHVFENPLWYGNDEDSQNRRSLKLEVCEKNLSGEVISVNHRECRDDDFYIQVKFSNGTVTIVALSHISE